MLGFAPGGSFDFGSCIKSGYFQLLVHRKIRRWLEMKCRADRMVKIPKLGVADAAQNGKTRGFHRRLGSGLACENQCGVSGNEKPQDFVALAIMHAPFWWETNAQLGYFDHLARTVQMKRFAVLGESPGIEKYAHIYAYLRNERPPVSWAQETGGRSRVGDSLEPGGRDLFRDAVDEQARPQLRLEPR